jgi:hypothetical protein
MRQKSSVVTRREQKFQLMAHKEVQFSPWHRGNRENFQWHTGNFLVLNRSPDGLVSLEVCLMTCFLSSLMSCYHHVYRCGCLIVGVELSYRTAGTRLVADPAFL